MTQPRHSAIVPTYNGRETVESTIRSILAQTQTNFELIVVDDGSTDDTEAIVRGFLTDGRIQLIQQENRGIAGARNRGIERARGELISFLDHDDLWMPDYLAAMGTVLDAAPDAGFAFTDGYALEHGTERIRRRTLFASSRPPVPLPTNSEAQLLELVRENFIWGSVTVRRSVLERVGGFDSSVDGVDDYDLWLRILASGAPAVIAPGRLILQRAKADSVSQDLAFMLDGIKKVCLKVAEDDSFPAPAREIAASRIPGLQSGADAVRGGAGVRGALRRIRRRAAATRTRLTSRRVYRSHPPDDVAEVLRRTRPAPGTE